jgi:alkylation response protein AidB-like acyl-CoA dehydrogenase
MDFFFSSEDKKFEKEVDNFLESAVSEEIVDEVESGLGFGQHSWDFLRKIGAKGWLTPTWPKRYGGIEASHTRRLIILDRMAYYRAPSNLVGVSIVGPTLIAFGTEEQKEKFLLPIARAEIEFSLGYTEPNAGSDLASLQTKAVRNGDSYIVNGQKMFNTRVHYSDYHWLLVRTDPDAPKHKGLSLFILDLKSPGITVTPIWCIDGQRTNMVYLDDVRIPANCLVGDENNGWRVATHALEYERIMFGVVGAYQRIFEELVAYTKVTRLNGIFLAEDPLIRQKLARLAIELSVVRLLGYRTAWMLDNNKKSTYESVVLKVFNTEFSKRLANTGMQILGPYGPIRKDSKWAQLRGAVELEYRACLFKTIGAGSTEILKTVIAQRGLGLPRK